MNSRVVAPTQFAFWVCMRCLLDKWLPSHVFLLNRIALHCIIFVPIQAWFCACPACPFCGIVYCTSVHSYIRIDASHLDTLDGQRVDMKHVMTEPNPRWHWWTCPEEKRTHWSNRRPGSKSEGPKALLVLTLTQCYPRQVPEHNPNLSIQCLFK